MRGKILKPYSNGTMYQRIFDLAKRRRIITLPSLVKCGYSIYDVTTVISPRKHKWGNAAANGAEYYFEPLDKVRLKDRKYKYRLRNKPMVRPENCHRKAIKIEVKAVKIKKNLEVVKAHSKSAETVE